MQVSLPQKEGMQADYTLCGRNSAGSGQLPGSRCQGFVYRILESAVKNGAQQALDDLNAALNYTGNDKITMTFEGTSDPTDAEDQSNTIDVVISENPAALCLGIIDMQTCKTQLEMAAESGIPVIIVDSGVDSDLFEAFCGIDNRAAGARLQRSSVKRSATRDRLQSHLTRVQPRPALSVWKDLPMKSPRIIRG